MRAEVESKGPRLSQLRIVVVQRLLADTNDVGGLLQTHGHDFVVLHFDTGVVQISPHAHLVYNLCEGSLLNAWSGVIAAD